MSMNPSTPASTHFTRPLPPTLTIPKRPDLTHDTNDPYAFPLTPISPISRTIRKNHPLKSRPISYLSRTTASPTTAVNSDAPPLSPTVDALQKQILSVCNNANVLAARLNESSSGFLAKILAIKEGFYSKRDDIEFFCTTSAIDPQRSPTSKGPEAAILEILDRAVYDLQISLSVLDDFLKRSNRFFPPPITRRSKLKKRVEEAWRNWTNLMIHLTLAMSSSSTVLAESATNNVAKLALVAGYPDWEEVDVDNAKQIFLSGDKYFMGYGVNKSYDTAFKRYTVAAKHIPEAQNMMGVMYENGLGRARDLAAAFILYSKAAERGCGDAYNNLGRLFESGLGVPVNFAKAKEHYEKSALLGCMDGMVNLGLLLECPPKKSTIQQDLVRAKLWYEKASDAGYARGQNCLGSLYYHGKGVKTDYWKAVELFKLATEQGNHHAQNNLGICFESGLGVPRDLVMAKHLYQTASVEGKHASATNNLGWIYMLEKNYLEAFRQFNIAIAQGSLDAIYNAATMYENGCVDGEGVVVQKDYSVALRLWEEGAKKGYGKCQLKLGEFLMEPPADFFEYRDPAEGFNWLTEAAWNGVIEACCLLGECFENGVGTNISLRDAFKWYARASERGHSRATFRLAEMYERGLFVDKKLDVAVKLFAEAEKLGCRLATDKLDVLSEML